MKWPVLALLSLLLLGLGCADEKQKEQLRQRELALDQKEQELNQKETALALQAAELEERKLHLDSTRTVDTSLINPALVGNWSVQMTCTEATCSGSAVGDIKTEEWNLSYEGSLLVAKARSGGQVVRTYAGKPSGATIELTERRDTTDAPVRMSVRLHATDASHLEGQREINRADCKVIYDLKLKKNDE